jgi:hypothetical protein
MTITAVVVPPAFFQPLSIFLWAALPSLLQDIGDVEKWVQGVEPRGGAIGRHIGTGQNTKTFRDSVLYVGNAIACVCEC